MLPAVDQDARDEAGTGPTRATIEELADWLGIEHASLIRFAYLVCGDAYAAQDLVQEAFLSAFRAGVRIQPSTGAYFRRVIVNAWRSRLRRRTLERRVSALSSVDADMSGPSDPDPVWEQIKLLPTQQRAVLALRYYEDMTERETADVLGISLGSVKKHASRAIEHLRTTLSED